MFFLTPPSAAVIRDFLARQASADFSYPEVGLSRETRATLAGYQVDHNRILLGTGARTFHQASAALQGWQMFALDWVRLYRPDTPLEAGRAVAPLIRHYGFWSLNPCRIVYVLNDKGTLWRYGFAYGTLAEHAEIGEERFSVEWHHTNDEVWYDLYAFSRPGAWLARLGYPLARGLQKRFARESLRAMAKAVSAPV